MADNTKGAARALADLERIVKQLRALDVDRARLIKQRDFLMERCRERGVKPSLIAETARVSAARVSQVAPKPAPDPEPVMPRDEVPRIPDVPLLSGQVTRHAERPYAPRVTAFVSLIERRGFTHLGTQFPVGGRDLADVLAELPQEVTRVLVTADWAAGVPLTGRGQAEAVRAWGMAGAPGWEPAERGHWTDKGSPVFRWEDVTGRTVEVASAEPWFGEEEDPYVCARAWHILGSMVQKNFGPGAVLLTTPATTGRDLWQRSLGPRVEYPTLSEPIRRLITETSGQGRTEVLPGSGAHLGFTYLDGRFMYAALTWGMPVGEPTVWRDRNCPLPLGAFDKRGRWLVRVEVPHGWAHVGLIGRRTSAGWDYPSEPGTAWETWADSEEVRLALHHGWNVIPLEGIYWEREGKPLTAWRDRLVGAWEEAGEWARQADNADGTGSPSLGPSWRAVRTACRSLLLFGLGAFAAGTATRERVVDREDEVPAGAQVFTTDDGRLRYVETVRPSAWQESMAHPEWAATVWARARVRLLHHRLADGRDGGALALPADSIVGFRTDAIYTAGPVPDWPDDGEIGRFRVKGRIEDGFQWPRYGADLLALRERSEEEV